VTGLIPVKRQLNFYNQPLACRVYGTDASAMQAYGSIGDGQTYSGAAALTFTCVRDPVERREDVEYLRFRENRTDAILTTRESMNSG